MGRGILGEEGPAFCPVQGRTENYLGNRQVDVVLGVWEVGEAFRLGGGTGEGSALVTRGPAALLGARVFFVLINIPEN